MLTSTYANQLLDQLVTNAGTMTVALSTTVPAVDDSSSTGISGFTEVTASGYTRQNLPTSSWSAAASRLKSTITDCVFSVPTADWGTIVAVCAFSGTTCVFIGLLDEEVNVVSGGDSLTIPAGTIAISLPL